MVTLKAVCGYFALLLGVLLFAGGTLIFFTYDAFILTKIIERMYLGRDSNGTFNEVLLNYVNTTYSLHFSIWSYSVTNANDVIQKGAKPELVEKGPYVFKERQLKDVQFTDHDSRLIYRNHRYYFYDASLSCTTCSLDDNVTVPNIVFQSLVDFSNAYPLVTPFINGLLKYDQETAYITVPIGKLLFEGFSDPVIETICKASKKICDLMGAPKAVGLFYNKNGSDDGVYEINTGNPDRNAISKVLSWNGMTTLNNSYWNGTEARTIYGTDGQLYTPGSLLLNDNLKIFSGFICRTIEMEYQEEAPYKDIPAYSYSPARSMSNMTLEKSKGFCMPNTPRYFNDTSVQPDDCLPSGFMDMSGCVPEAPRIYVSSPHFYGSPKAVHDGVNGLNDPSDADKTSILIEPYSGIILMAEQRSQLNIGVLRGRINLVKNMAEATIVPIIWVKESAFIDEVNLGQVFAIMIVRKYLSIGTVVTALVGLALVIGFTVLKLMLHNYNRLEESTDSSPREENLPESQTVELNNG